MKMLFELAREDNPPLFDELIKFPKGTKRLNRLRTLAHEGLFRQRQFIASQEASIDTVKSTREPVGRIKDHALEAASSELFGPSMDT